MDQQQEQQPIQKIGQKPFLSKLSILGVLALMIGLLAAIVVIQQRQDTRSRASEFIFPPAGIALTDIIGWWRGEGNANDETGANNGTISGLVFGEGKIGQAFVFDGVDDYLSLGNNPTIIGKGAFSVSAWFKTTGTTGMILQQRERSTTMASGSAVWDGHNGEYLLSVGGRNNASFVHEPGKICWATFGDGLYGFNFCSTKVVNDGQYHQVTATREDDGTGKIYIDGVLDSSQNAPSRTLIKVNVFVGADKRDNAAFFKGIIDEVSIFTKALSVAEVQMLYASAPTPTEVSGPTASPTPSVFPEPTISTTPEPTGAEGGTFLDLKLSLHGIGTGGDSANPQGLGNVEPAHPQRTAVVELYNTQNQLVSSQEAIITYASASGKFEGRASLATTLQSGFFTLKVKTNQYLRALFPGVQHIVTGQINQLNQIALIVGDINNDNVINIVDYNILMGCYSDLLPAVACTPEDSLLSDMNDDGRTNQFDYNLFLRELQYQRGQ